jgi:hypothetical protein
MLGSSIFPWGQVIRYLSRRDCRNLRLLCRSVRQEIDNRLQTPREFKKILQYSDLRALIRTIFVPVAFSRPVPQGHAGVMVRPPYPNPSPWIISVMTMVSYLSTPIDLRSVFHCVDVVDFSDITSEQRVDLENAKEECRCEVKQSKNGAPDQLCINQECGCLSAFFPGILDIHYGPFCRGDPEFAEVKAKKRGRPPTRTFENQCTMRICMSRTTGPQQKNGQLWNIINLKMFQNGKIQMTGCKSLEQARGAVQFLLRKLMEKAPAMRAKRDCMTQLRCFGLGETEAENENAILPQTLIRRLVDTKRSTLPLELPLTREVLFSILQHVDNVSLFACRRTCVLFRNIVESADFWKHKCERDIRCVCAVDETKAKPWYMSHKYNGRFQRMERVKNADHFSHPLHLYCRYSPKALKRHRAFLVVEEYENLFVAGEQIAMINSDFRTNFDVNLPVLFKILYQEYGSKKKKNQSDQISGGKILQCSYSPDDYVALNVKYESPIPPDPIPDEIGSDDKKTVISFFIFRTGSVIINSARSIAQEVEAYEFINSILCKYYSRIWHVETSKPKKKKQKTNQE